MVQGGDFHEALQNRLDNRNVVLGKVGRDAPHPGDLTPPIAPCWPIMRGTPGARSRRGRSRSAARRLACAVLPREDGLSDGLTSPTNIAAYLWSTVAAEDLTFDLLRRGEPAAIGQTLTALAQLERSHGFFYNWYDPATGQRAHTWPGGSELRPFLSVVDNGWLAAALILIGNTRPEFRQATDAILEPMNFGVLLRPVRTGRTRSPTRVCSGAGTGPMTTPSPVFTTVP